MSTHENQYEKCIFLQEELDIVLEFIEQGNKLNYTIKTKGS